MRVKTESHKMHSHTTQVNHLPLQRMGATLVKTLIKQEFAEWLLTAMKNKGLNRRKIAQAIGVEPSSVTRWTQTDNITLPKIEHMRNLIAILGSAPPGWSSIPEPAIVAGPELVALPQAEGPHWNGNLSEYQVSDFSMQLLGFMPGDMVKIDYRIKPSDGDVVVVRLHGLLAAQSRIVLRVYKDPGYVLPATADAAGLEVHELKKTATFIGTVYEMTRRRLVTEQ